MKELLNICPICLRTDRKLKAIAAVLSVYHDELTDYSLEISDPRYCSDCECLLRKTYNFHRKCSTAAKTLKKWLKTTTKNKVSPNQLHLKLPPITLDNWTPENNKIFTFICSDNLHTPVLTEISMTSKPDTNAEKQLNVRDKLDTDIIKEEVIENTIHSESLFKMEIHCEDYQITEVSETLFQNVNKDTEDTANVFQNKLINDNTFSNAGLSGIVFAEEKKIKRSEKKRNDMSKQLNNTSSGSDKLRTKAQISYIELLHDIDDIENNRSNKDNNVNNTVESAHPALKLTVDEHKSSHDMLQPSYDTTQSAHNIPELIDDMVKSTHDINIPKLTINMSKFKSNVPKTSNDMPKLTDDMAKIANDVHVNTNNNNNSVTCVDTDDVDAEIICLEDDDSKNDNVIVIDDEIEYPDDASLNSDDDCDDYLYTPPKKRKIKMTLNELANIALNDEDIGDDYVSDKNNKTNKSAKNYGIDKVILTEKCITSKLESMNEALDSICENWNITSLLDVGIPNIPNNEVKNITRKLLTKRKVSDKVNSVQLKCLKKKGIRAKINHMSADLDSINDKCEKIIEDYKNGLRDPKERVKAELIRKFESWGELKTDDGFIFDKDVILSCLDMVTERLLRQLLSFLHGATTLSPGAAIILKRIQSKQHENQYESVFNIEYMTTDKEMQEEFERRKTYECYVTARYKCEVCYQGFKHERLLEYHKKCHDESYGTVSCTICCVRHHSRRALKKHMAAHVTVYKCKLCPLITYYRLSMINHYEQHKGTIYKCEPCGTTYKSKSAYLSHHSHTHSSGAHVCTACGRAFISPLGLKNHAGKKHRGEAPVAEGAGVKCEACGLTFPSQEAHARHQRTLHGAPLVYNYKKRAPKSLKPRKKPIMTCRVCDTVGHSYGWLTRHFGTEHPAVDMAAVYADKQTYLCDVCGKGFSNKYSLREHAGFHSGVMFPCASCVKRFATRAALRRHRLTHAPPGFCCERCGKKFHSHPNLYNHMRSHIGDRRFKCNICGKGFLHRCSLKEHIRGVHNHERRVRKRGVAETSLGVTETPYGVTETNHGVTVAGMHGVTAAGMHGVTVAGMHEVTEIGAKRVLVIESGEMDQNPE